MAPRKTSDTAVAVGEAIRAYDEKQRHRQQMPNAALLQATLAQANTELNHASQAVRDAEFDLTEAQRRFSNCLKECERVERLLAEAKERA